MSVFTDNELAYLLSQRLGRLATVRPDGRPQIAPVGFRYNAELDLIDIGGRFMSRTKKFRNILHNPNVSLVIDDVLPPWQPRGVEIRGTARTLPTGGTALFGAGASYVVDDAIIRITPFKSLAGVLIKRLGGRGIGWSSTSDANEVHRAR